MSPADATTTVPTLRERRRAVATQEILGAAERHIVEHGPHALSLRAVARDLGMTVQALYHYFASRDDLITALVTRAFEDLADAVQFAVDRAHEDPSVPRLVHAAEGYRRWAIDHPERFQLIFGSPLRGYAAPPGGPTTQAVQRMSGIFQRELFAGYSMEQLAAADMPTASPEMRAHLGQLSPDGLGALPPSGVHLLLNAWGRMHGLVVLEVFGHTSFLGGHQGEVFQVSMAHLVEDVHRRLATAR
ncbi:TetR/AcrR family transcriptional regulator [Streptomyces sp. NPDC047315]|uniref:TetR/AcrR family transcriptional regulator n=1 Tax=Streptomyces sp. NPDC047315 TaxID=3155142 RepID=UPI0033EC5109